MTGDDSLRSSFDADLNAPPNGVPAHPPVTTRPQVLPFGELTWENFERLCYRLAGNAASEMLAVNAETVGLMAERAPGEIGFAHAVFGVR
ncbi:MAG: hypothetical protein WA459_11630 [Stellaceae bacterium]